MPKKIVIAGIGTGVGKTYVSAILAQAMEADYWKPIQTGTMEQTDSERVRELISNPASQFHPEAYSFKQPIAPHAAAAAEGVRIDLSRINLPQTERPLIIELAGGLMVPLNEIVFNIDLLVQWKLPVVLVSKNYLGSINHTILSFLALQYYRIPIAGIIFNGLRNPATEKILLDYTNAPYIASINEEAFISKYTVNIYADWIRDKVKKLLE